VLDLLGEVCGGRGVGGFAVWALFSQEVCVRVVYELGGVQVSVLSYVAESVEEEHLMLS
jgi:hypothetical protein